MAVAGVVVALSIFIVFVGLPASEASISEQCIAGVQCTQSASSRSFLLSTPFAVIPFLSGVAVAAGLAKGWIAVSWGGAVSLLGFSFIGLFSIGLFYLPMSLVLIGLLWTIRLAPLEGLRPADI